MSDPTAEEPHGAALSATHAALLERIQHLAYTSAQLMTAMYAAGLHADIATDTVTRINTLDRTREMTEIQARAAGVPAAWIERVRTLGQRGQPWHADQPMPDPPPDRQRRTVQRIADDVERLKDMAALHAAYQHTLRADPTLPALEEIAVQQFRRNMTAVWMRAGRTADMIGLIRTAVPSTWTPAPAEWAERVQRYLTEHDAEDLRARWIGHADTAVAAQARKSLAILRRAGLHGPDIPLPQMPTSPERMLAQAAAAAGGYRSHGTEERAIGAAVEAALPDGPGGQSLPEPAVGDESAITARPAHQDNGPDP